MDMHKTNISVAVKSDTICRPLFYLNLFVLVLFFLISACSTAPKPSAPASPGFAHPRTSSSHFNDDEIEQQLRREYLRWQGIRHRLGGNGSGGIDCSGFVKAVYKDVFNVDLPRTTRVQVKQGRPISFKELRPGDLVFFQPPTYPRHVGIYIGRSEFVHASKNKGVTLSRIDEAYWEKYYWTARRILPAGKRP